MPMLIPAAMMAAPALGIGGGALAGGALAAGAGGALAGGALGGGAGAGLGVGALGAGALGSAAPMMAPMAAASPFAGGALGSAAPMMAPMAMQSPLTVGGGAGLMKAGAGGLGATKTASGLGGFLGMNQKQSAALPGLMQMMGGGMQGGGGGGGQQPQQQPPQAQAGPNPAAIQAAIQMMERLKTPSGGFPQGLPAQFPGTRDRGGVRPFGL